jgi:hypothetical protein
MTSSSSVHLRAWVLVALCSSVAANCQQCSQTPSPQRGNVDRVADVVLVDGVVEGDAAPHTFAVLSNPDLGFVRILDLTVGDFVLGPNQYFPLSVPVGRHTTALATAVDLTTAEPSVDQARVYAIDAADDTLHVLCTPDGADGCGGFSSLAQLPTGRAPSDVAVMRTAADDVLVVVTLPGSNQVASAVLSRTDATLRGEWTLLNLPGAQAPTAVVADPLGDSFVVADAISPLLFVLRRDGNELAVVQTISVLAPSIALSAGVVDVGDGLAPVVLASGAPPATVSVVRLYRPGYREDRYALLGSQELSLPAAAVYVPDQRPRTVEAGAEPTAVVCCRGLSTEQIDAGEASASWGSVWLADGNMLHLRIDATGVRLFDDNPLSVSAFDDVDWNGDERLWQPISGGEAFRPVVNIVAAAGGQDRRFIQSLSTLRLEYEAVLPALDAASAQWDGLLLRSPSVPNSGLRDGDELTITGADSCTITTTVVRSDEPDAVVVDDDDCLSQAPLAMTVRSNSAFVVSNELRFLGVITDVAGDAPLLPIADRALELRFAAAGAPLRGSVLSLPVAPNVLPFGLRLSARILESFGQAALVPTAIAGGIMTIPGVDQVPTRTRRMVLTSAGGDDATRSVVLSCDEAETSIGRVDNVR